MNLERNDDYPTESEWLECIFDEMLSGAGDTSAEALDDFAIWFLTEMMTNTDTWRLKQIKYRIHGSNVLPAGVKEQFITMIDGNLDYRRLLHEMSDALGG